MIKNRVKEFHEKSWEFVCKRESKFRGKVRNKKIVMVLVGFLFLVLSSVMTFSFLYVGVENNELVTKIQRIIKYCDVIDEYWWASFLVFAAVLCLISAVHFLLPAKGVKEELTADTTKEVYEKINQKIKDIERCDAKYSSFKTAMAVLFMTLSGISLILQIVLTNFVAEGVVEEYGLGLVIFLGVIVAAVEVGTGFGIWHILKTDDSYEISKIKEEVTLDATDICLEALKERDFVEARAIISNTGRVLEYNAEPIIKRINLFLNNAGLHTLESTKPLEKKDYKSYHLSTLVIQKYNKVGEELEIIKAQRIRELKVEEGERRREAEKRRIENLKNGLLEGKKLYEEAIKGDKVDKNLVFSAADFGDMDACIYIGSQFISDYESNRFTKEEKEQKAKLTARVLEGALSIAKQLGMQANAECEFLLTYARVRFESNDKNGWKNLLSALRRFQNIDDIREKYEYSLENVIGVVVDTIDDIDVRQSQPSPSPLPKKLVCRFQNGAICTKNSTTYFLAHCEYRDPGNCPTALMNNGLTYR